MSILQDIYNGYYSPIEKPVNIPSSLLRKEQAFFGEVEKVMGQDFLEKHRGSICEVGDHYNFDSFREGFRLGVSLMLEVLDA